MVDVARLLGVAAVSLLLSSHARAEGTSPRTDTAAASTEATSAGKAWLVLVDDSRYAESWTRASSLFRRQLARDQWVSMVAGVRGGLGKLRQRELESASYAETGSGKLVVLVWKSTFETLPRATEQVTMLLDDGAWRCAGYFVRPR
jgi:hypothetical protein